MKRMSMLFVLALSVLTFISFNCGESKAGPSREAISELNLKRGEVISCAPGGAQFGTVDFDMSCSGKVREEFNLGIKLLHSFEYDEAEKVFSKIIDEQPGCAMSYWGVAMSNFHPLWTPPSETELKKGSKAIAIAKTLTEKTDREGAYINSIAAFYDDWDKLDHKTRTQKFETAMEKLNADYPKDMETSIFYALSLNAAADPNDKTFSKQKKAGKILDALYPGQPNHPGVVHYIIHTYDSPELAHLALDAARRYASVAPSSAHATHMPSHIFTRLGLWDECISSNKASQESAKCYAESTGIKGHWDEELHALDYLIYAYLQKGDNKEAKKQLDYLYTIKEIHPANFKVAYAFGSIPSRYVMENKLWKEAAALEFPSANFDWKDFPWQRANIHFAKGMGSVHIGDLAAARKQLNELNQINAKLLESKNTYQANLVAIQAKSVNAWILFKEGKNDDAIAMMNEAAALEDKTEKHPVTPGEIIPAKELLGDLLMEMNKPALALKAYEENIAKHPKRLNGMKGLEWASQRNSR